MGAYALPWLSAAPVPGSRLKPATLTTFARPCRRKTRTQVNDEEACRDFGRRRSTVFEVRQTLAASKRVADEAAGLEAGSEGAGQKDRHQEQEEPVPAPFRGTFWDEDDGEATFPARRVSYDLHAGKGYVMFNGSICMGTHDRRIWRGGGGDADDVGGIFVWLRVALETIVQSGMWRYGRESRRNCAASATHETLFAKFGKHV